MGKDEGIKLKGAIKGHGDKDWAAIAVLPIQIEETSS
jgi:hypothetical protein